MQCIHKTVIKPLITFIFALMTLSLVYCAASASPLSGAAGLPAAVKEIPHVRVIIDGVKGNYNDTPLEINDRVLLPFRELLNKLGVPNDSEHISWNDEDESVTVWDGANRIQLFIGDPVIILNGEKIPFDVAPYFYQKNNRTYVPVRAVSELLGKYIMWEGSTSTVYIRNKANYAETVALLERVYATDMKAKMKADLESSVKIAISAGRAPLPGADADGVLRAAADVSQHIEADNDMGIIHITQLTNTQDINIGSELYKYLGRVYLKTAGPGFTWTDVTDGDNARFGTLNAQVGLLESQMGGRPVSDIAMALAADKGPSGTYSLVGEPLSIADVNSLLNTVSTIIPQDPGVAYDLKINAYQLEETLDADLNPLKAGVYADIDMSVTEKTANGNYMRLDINVIMDMTIVYGRPGPDFQIDVPNDIKRLARNAATTASPPLPKGG